MCFEYFDTASCQPPTVPTDAFLPVCGSTVTSNLPLTGVVWFAAYAYGQLRMNAALPEANALRAPSSSYDVTPRGEMLPTQPRNMFRVAIAFGLLIDALPLSMKWPPPDDASHSSESHVRPSYALPW